MTLLENYLAGQHHEVWHRLTQDSSIGAPEVTAIAVETLSRCYKNVVTITSRLEEMGFRFGQLADWEPDEYWSGFFPIRTIPDNRVDRRISIFESFCGPIPISLKTFWRAIGGVNLIGHHPDWQLSVQELDPLFLP